MAVASNAVIIGNVDENAVQILLLGARAFCEVNLNDDKLGCGHATTDEMQTEYALRKVFGDAGWSFSVEHLEDLTGFFICEAGHGSIVVADDLSCLERIYFYFQMLGHVALGQLDPIRLSLWYEIRPTERVARPRSVEIQGLRADRWAERVLSAFLRAEPSVHAGYRDTLHKVLQNHEGPWSGLHRGLHRAARTIYSVPGASRLRDSAFMVAVIDKVYDASEYLRKRPTNPKNTPFSRLGPRPETWRRESA